MAKLILISVFVCLNLLAEAQNSGSSQIADSTFIQIAQVETNTMRDSLILSSQQVEGILVINRNYYSAIAQLRNQNLNPDQRSLAKNQLDLTRNNQLAGVLTTNQYTQYQGMLQRRTQWIQQPHHKP